jgi:hypothetical protein
MDKWAISIWCILAAVGLGICIWSAGKPVLQATEKPFNVYQAGPNCVYVIGEVGRTVAITALPGPCQ